MVREKRWDQVIERWDQVIENKKIDGRRLRGNCNQMTNVFLLMLTCSKYLTVSTLP